MMKYLVILLAFLGSSPFTFADCSSSGVYLYPSNSQLSQNGCIFIEGYAYSQPFVEAIADEYPVTLVSGSHTVPCQVIKEYKGMMSLSMIVLKPKELLKVNQVYTLSIANLDKSNESEPTHYDDKTKKYVPYSWKINAAADMTAPSWVNAPSYIENNYIAFGCGPAVTADFKSLIKDSSPVWVVAELEHTEGQFKTTYTYPVQVTDYKLFQIGHGMCSGAFTYQSKDSYRLRFQLYDQSANTNGKWTEWIDIKNPMDHHKEF